MIQGQYKLESIFTFLKQSQFIIFSIINNKYIKNAKLINIFDKLSL